MLEAFNGSRRGGLGFRRRCSRGCVFMDMQPGRTRSRGRWRRRRFRTGRRGRTDDRSDWPRSANRRSRRGWNRPRRDNRSRWRRSGNAGRERRDSNGARRGSNGSGRFDQCCTGGRWSDHCGPRWWRAESRRRGGSRGDAEFLPDETGYKLRCVTTAGAADKMHGLAGHVGRHFDNVLRPTRTLNFHGESSSDFDMLLVLLLGI
jgi:hypothetical protein